VRPFVCSAGVFIGQTAEGEGGQEVASAGGPGDVRRPTPGAAALLACWRGSVSVTEYCGSVLVRSRRSATCREQREKRGGPRRVLPLLLHDSRLGSGQRGLGSTAEMSTSMATGLERTGTTMLTVKLIFLDFCPPRVRSNACKNFKFEFLKTATVGCQDIGQGFQGYFCYKER
jgi:hypothetical protein